MINLNSVQRRLGRYGQPQISLHFEAKFCIFIVRNLYRKIYITAIITSLRTVNFETQKKLYNFKSGIIISFLKNVSFSRKCY